MRLTDYKSHFKAELELLYPETEINTFFYRLVEHFTNLRRIDLALNPEYKLDKSQKGKFEKALSRLQQHEPIQYILGGTEFYGLSFKVNKHVLIPRPETEELVEWVLSATTDKDLSILDIGTGSGSIPIALAKNLAKAQLTGVDISEKALNVAKENAAQNQVKVNFKTYDILNPGPWAEKFDIIVANPPYIPVEEKSKMQSNVLDYEPQQALFVQDKTPLIFYRKILDFAQTHLHKNGQVYLELNEFLKDDLNKLFNSYLPNKIYFKNDIHQKTRMARLVF